MPLQAITFDAAGTLIHLQKPVGETYSEIAANFGIHASPSDIETAFRTVWNRTSGPFSNQQGSIDESPLPVRRNHLEREWWRNIVRNVFAQAAPNYGTQFDEFFTELYDHFENPDCWRLDSDAISVLQQISSRGLKIGLLSNFDYRLRKILTGLDIIHYFDALILSGEIQASKPDPRMFASIQQALHITDPTLILHVGDDPECDVTGAEQFGFCAFRVKLGKIPLRDVIKQLD